MLFLFFFLFLSKMGFWAIILILESLEQGFPNFLWPCTFSVWIDEHVPLNVSAGSIFF